MVSAEGPALAVGDANGDGLQDVFFGSCKFKHSAMYWQNPDGTFSLRTPQPILNDSIFEDVDAVFIDLDNDADLDLVVAAGGNEWRGQDEPMKQRWYRNDGKGHFERFDFPGVYMTASCVRSCDFNNDGLTDLFFGARALPWNYGITPNSALLLNKGNGQFEDVAEKTASGLHQAGLVKNAAWADLDADGDQDLVLAVEWEPVTVFVNETSNSDKPKFSRKNIDARSGWWNLALPCDLDGDGDLD
ncbi:MAG: FG-GAP repeat domain-containing protein, partial [Saprospiraceae bacterium]